MIASKHVDGLAIVRINDKVLYEQTSAQFQQKILSTSINFQESESTVGVLMYEEIKAPKGKDYWVIRVNLADHQKLFQMLQRESAEVNVIHFLVRLSAVVGQSSFSRSLLRHRLKTGDRIVLMLDGFDEIESQCQTATIRLLKSVPLVDLYVTTRSHASSELQFQLSRLSITLDNFSHQDRIDCLTKFWSSHLNADDLTGTVQVVMETMARSLIDRLSKTLNASESFIGIPLQCRILAECFLHQLREIIEGFKNESTQKEKLEEALCLMENQHFDLVSLYRLLMNTKRRVFCEEKAETQAANPILAWAIHIAIADMEAFLKRVAIEMIFSNKDDVEMLLPSSRSSLPRTKA